MASDSQISFSFFPGEVITEGTIIEVRASRPVSPRSAQSVVILVHLGKQMNIAVTVVDKVVRIRTSGLSAGGYDLVVGELLDTTHSRLNEFFVTRLIIRAKNGLIPSNLRIEHAVCLAVGDTSTLRLHPGQKHYSPGTRFVEFIKATDPEAGGLVNLAFDENGNSVDGAQLLADVSRRRFEKFGRLHETLWHHLQNITDQESVNIVVWPDIEKDGANRNRITNRANALSSEEVRFRDEIRGMKSALMSKLKELGAQMCDDPTHIPCIRATVAAKYLCSIAELDEVGVVLLNDTSVVEDLSNSIAIARSDAVLPELGYSGKNVKVAVFEDGPCDTSDLVFAKRYTDKPLPSHHARLTSAIIKNSEKNRPHGHAPGCELYSANSGEDAALLWATSQGCTVISQSFHRLEEPKHGTLQKDDILKDWLATQPPYPTIVQAAGNFWDKDSDQIVLPSDEYVNHKGYNTLTVGSHDDNAHEIAGSSVYRNPESPHGDRELPELVANGTACCGTSFAAPVVAGAVALIQEVDSALKSLPEACRAIMIASTNRQVGGTWWNGVGSHQRDSKAGAGALDAHAAVLIAQHEQSRNEKGAPRGWAFGTLNSTDFDVQGISIFRYYVQAPQASQTPLAKLQVKVALAWQSEVTKKPSGQLSSVLTLDLDLLVYNSHGDVAAISASRDNSYEVAEFTAASNETYNIAIRRSSGDSFTHYGVAWTVAEITWVADHPGAGHFIPASSLAPAQGLSIGSYETNNDVATVTRGAKYSAILSFGVEQTTVSQVLTGLNMLDIASSSQADWGIRISSYADNNKSTPDGQLPIHIDSWSDTYLYNAKVSWLKLTGASMGIRAGSFNTEEVRPYTTPGNVSKIIKFGGTKFPVPPTVFVGLSGFAITGDWRINLYTSDITTTSFTIHVDTWSSSTQLWSARATWIAFPATLNVRVGKYTGDGNWKGYNGFNPIFTRPPTVFTALTKFDAGHNTYLRVKLITKASETGMNWEIGRRFKPEALYEVRASYFALDV